MEEETKERTGGLVACNLRPLKTRWETARLLCLNGTGDGMRRTGRNVEGSREDGRETYALLLPKGEVLASRPRHATRSPCGGLAHDRVPHPRLLENASGTPCLKIG